MRQCGAGGFRAGRAAEWHAARAAAGRCTELNETNGSWGTAQEIAANLNTGGAADVDSVSCASPGNCAADGQSDYGGYNAAFLNEKNGA
jgi:hypothetical protein